jgi:hypothetical protein
MKRLHSSPNSTEVEILKNLLEEAGIFCQLRNQQLSRIVPTPPFYEELWVHDENFEQAAELVNSWKAARPVQGSSWTCPVCGERIEGQFSSCWSCGALREPATWA